MMEELLREIFGSSMSSAVITAAVNGIFLIISLILAIVGALLINFLFLAKKNENKYKGFAGFLYDFLNFKTMFAETLLRILYLVCAIFVTVNAFLGIFTNGNIFFGFFSFILTTILGNVAIRLIYEFLLVILIMCRNTSEMNKKLGALNHNLTGKEDTTTTAGPVFVTDPITEIKAEIVNKPSAEPVSVVESVSTANSAPEAPKNVCAGCGNELRGEQQFCPKCGTKRG